MKTINKIVALAIAVLFVVSCNNQSQEGSKVKIETKFGDMVVVLYDETPQHRDNFLKLAKDGFYNDLLFHRVIKGFMVQGGDPESKGAESNAQLGSGGPGYTVPAEIVFPKYFHKKGVLAAARQGDQVNPEKKSSGSQFYIVQGKPLSLEELKKIEEKKNDRAKSEIFRTLTVKYNDTIQALQQAQDMMGLEKLREKLIAETDLLAAKNPENFKFTEEQVEAYTTIGGTPFLDDAYTVFGEVIEGLAIIDSIAAQPTVAGDRPLEDVIMNIKVLD